MMSSSDSKPVKMAGDCLRCGGQWEGHYFEWPPKIVVCTACAIPLKLIAYDPHTGKVAYTQAT